jgi:UDP-2-acetamido-3-amino-2,3-dideoxy-glucuronate N-acetyltransferase
MALVFGLIGCGFWGKNHKKLMENKKNINLKYICDLKIKEGKENNIIMIKDYHKILNDKEVNAVIIATPPSTHYKIAKESLISGKHVLVEKPMTSNSKEAEKLIEIAEKNKKHLMVGNIFMYNPAVQYLKKIIEKKEIGKIMHIDVRRCSKGILKERTREDNVLMDVGIHDISVFLYLIQEKPLSVNAFGNSLSELSGELEDIAILNLKFKDSPVKCSLNVNWASPRIIKEISVIGDEKTAIFDDTSKEKLKIYEIALKNSNKSSFEDTLQTFSPVLQEISPLELQFDHFIECIQTEKKPLSDGKNGLEIIKILECAQESMKNNGKEVLINNLLK